MNERASGDATPTLALGVLLAVPAAIPGIISSWRAGAGLAGALALVGAVSLVTVPVGLCARTSSSGRILLSGIGFFALPLALFGAVLISATHHRPLGGATYAVVAGLLVALGVGLAFRAHQSRTAKVPWQKVFRVACVASMISASLLLLGSAAPSNLLEALGIVGAAAATSLLKIPASLRRLPRPAVLASWLCLLAAALLFARNPALGALLTAEAPLSFSMLSWLGGSS